MRTANVAGSHHAIAARPKSAARDPISNAGETLRHRTTVRTTAQYPRAADGPRRERDRRPQHTMTTTLGMLQRRPRGRRTDLPWPLPADAGQVREKGYFVEGGKESLPPKWDSK